MNSCKVQMERLHALQWGILVFWTSLIVQVQDLSRMSLAHHELESDFILFYYYHYCYIFVIVTIITIMIIVVVVDVFVVIIMSIIVMLLSRGAIRTLMITGDHHHTAIAVARGAGMLPTGAKLVILEAAAQPSKVRSALKGDLARTMACTALLRVSFDILQQPHVEARSEGFGDIKVQPAQALLPGTNQLVQSLPEHVQGQPHSQAAFTQRLSLPPAQEQKEMQDRLDSPSELLQNVVQECNFMQVRSKLAWANDSIGDMHAHVQRHPPQALLSRKGLQQEDLQPGANDLHGNQPLPSETPSAQDHHVTRADLSCLRFPLQGLHRASSTCLLFTSEGYSLEAQPQTALKALQSIAQGQAQCCVTGQAFEYLLQHAEPAVIESVMQHAVVFAHMQSHQKGQIMELLSSRGLDRVMADQQHHIPVFPHIKLFCSALLQVASGFG